MGGQRIRLACLSSPNVDSSEIVTPLPNIQLAPLPLTLEMPVPWEALIPFGKNLGNFLEYWWWIKHENTGLLTSMFGVTGTLMSMVKRAANDGKVYERFGANCLWN